MKRKSLALSIITLTALCLIALPAQAGNDSCAQKERKKEKAISKKGKLENRKTKLEDSSVAKEAKFDRQKQKKEDRIFGTRKKNYDRYSGRCYLADQPPTLTESPGLTEDDSAVCRGANRKEGKLLGQQAKNADRVFNREKLERKIARMVERIDNAQKLIDDLQLFIDTNCTAPPE